MNDGEQTRCECPDLSQRASGGAGERSEDRESSADLVKARGECLQIDPVLHKQKFPIAYNGCSLK